MHNCFVPLSERQVCEASVIGYFFVKSHECLIHKVIHHIFQNLSTESNCPAGKAAHFACNAHCFHRSFSSDLFKQICKHGYEFAVRIKYFLSGCNTANFLITSKRLQQLGQSILCPYRITIHKHCYIGIRINVLHCHTDRISLTGNRCIIMLNRSKANW